MYTSSIMNSIMFLLSRKIEQVRLDKARIVTVLYALYILSMFTNEQFSTTFDNTHKLYFVIYRQCNITYSFEDLALFLGFHSNKKQANLIFMPAQSKY